MRFKSYMELAPGETMPSVPASQPMQQPGIVQQGQQQLPPGTENEDWYKQLMKSGMSPEWQHHFMQQQLNAPPQKQGVGGMLKQAGRTAMNRMMAPSTMQPQEM